RGWSGNASGWGIAVDADANAYVAGRTSSPNFPTVAGAFQPTGGSTTDAFAANLNPAGSALVYSTYLGGSGFDSGAGIAVDAAGNAYVTGFTASTDFPTTAGAFQTAFAGTGPFGFGDAFVTKLDPTGSALVYSTYLGGSGDDLGSGIAVDTGGNAYVAGGASTNFPPTPVASQTTFASTSNIDLDVFVTKLDPTGSAPVYS